MNNQSQQALKFQPTTAEITSLPSITDFIISGFLRASHTFRIYRGVIQALNLDGEYLPLEIPRIEGRPDAGMFREYIDSTRINPNIRSLVISDPYKQLALTVCDETNHRAKICEAVNLIVHEDGKLKGLNIDGEAFLLGIGKSIAFSPQRGVIFGCGGVSTAVATILSWQLTDVLLVEVDKGRAEKLADTLKKLNPALNCSILLRPNIGDFRGYDFFYNGTGLGKASNDSASEGLSPIVQGDQFPTSGIAIDANYTPAMPRFLKQLEAYGMACENGRSHMLGYTTLHLSMISGRTLEFDDVKRIADSL